MGEEQDARRERGLGFIESMLGDNVASAMRGDIDAIGFGKETGTWAMDFAFGTIWTREGLERKLRSCVVLGILMALRQTEEIKIHTHIAMKNGLTKDELEEILYLSIPYAGFPAAKTAKSAMIAAFDEIANGTGPVS